MPATIKKDSAAVRIWERTGITEHPGGTKATERLIQRCRVKPGQRVLDLGCGTGYTACRLAKSGVEVVGADVDGLLLRHAQRRLSRQATDGRVGLVQTDIQYLPFASATFDVVLAESVIVFCDAHPVMAESYRVLKPGGYFGINELTCLQRPSDTLSALFSLATGMNVRLRSAHEWQAIIEEAGFIDTSSSCSRLRLMEQLVSHIKVDGIMRYVAGSLVGLLDPRIMRVYLDKEMLKALLKLPRYLRYLGYGLYVGRKAASSPRGGFTS